MILNIHSDSSNLRTLSDNLMTTTPPALIVSVFAAEAELGVFFINVQEVLIMHLFLHELGHPKPLVANHYKHLTAVHIKNNMVKTITHLK